MCDERKDMDLNEVIRVWTVEELMEYQSVAGINNSFCANFLQEYFIMRYNNQGAAVIVNSCGEYFNILNV